MSRALLAGTLAIALIGSSQTLAEGPVTHAPLNTVGPRTHVPAVVQTEQATESSNIQAETASKANATDGVIVSGDALIRAGKAPRHTISRIHTTRRARGHVCIAPRNTRAGGRRILRTSPQSFQDSGTALSRVNQAATNTGNLRRVDAGFARAQSRFAEASGSIPQRRTAQPRRDPTQAFHRQGRGHQRRR